ncbi:MAG TPA: class I SAM-dependent methyltransferase [Myxococcota bacterium]|nr:class I SAM-dependent methyltransferase [Myxococcota bacterium]
MPPKSYTQSPVAHAAMYNRIGRERKADKILAVLRDYFGNLKSLTLLDASCSTGIMTQSFGRHFGKVVGIDIDAPAVAHARQANAGPNITYQVMDATRMRFRPARFDVVICNQMYEHVGDSGLLMDEIHRVLKPNGVCYFGATNRLKLIETHYGRIPLLSIMPRSWAHRVLRVLGRADAYAETLLTMWELRRLVERFELLDWTGKVIRDPVRYRATDLFRPGGPKQKLALAILQHAAWASPGYIWLLRKSV